MSLCGSISQLRPRALLLTLLILLGLFPLPASALFVHRAQPQHHRDSGHEIAALDESWRQALLRADQATLRSIMADDFVAITALGTIENRDQFLAHFADSSLHLAAISYRNRHVRILGSTAMVTVHVNLRGALRHADIAGEYRETRVYVAAEDGSWKLATLETQRRPK